MNAKKNINLKSLKIRDIERRDLKLINNLMQLVEYDVGLTNLQMYYECSNVKNWKCIEKDGEEIIAVYIGNLLPNGVNYGFTFVVHPEYRGRGVGSLFNPMWENIPIFGSESLLALSIYANMFQCWQGKMIDFYGMVPKDIAEKYAIKYKSNNVQVTKIISENIPTIYNYDKNIIKLDRRKFLENWCCNEGSESVVAMENNCCVGFGVLRNFTGMKKYAISPLYADNDEIAAAIFAELAKFLDSQYLFVPVQSDKRVSIHFCHFLNLGLFPVEMRVCNVAAVDYAKSLDMSKVYTTHDYWPV